MLLLLYIAVAYAGNPCSPCGSKCDYNPAEGWGVCLPSLTCFGAIDGNAPAVTCPTAPPTMPPTTPRPPCSPCGSQCNYNPAEGWGVCLPDLTCFGAIDGNAPAVTCPTPAPAPFHIPVRPGGGGVVITPPPPLGGIHMAATVHKPCVCGAKCTQDGHSGYCQRGGTCLITNLKPSCTPCKAPKNCQKLECSADNQWTPTGKGGCPLCAKCITGCVADSCPGGQECGAPVNGVRTCEPIQRQRCSNAKGAANGGCPTGWHCQDGFCANNVP